MTWEEALERVVARTKHERYRQLCADDHPDHVVWRQRVLEQTHGVTATYPTVRAMAGNVLVSGVRAAGAAIRGEAVRVPAEVLEERRAICAGCEQFDPGPARCRLCGCYTAAKLTLATERCPLSPPKWGVFTAPPAVHTHTDSPGRAGPSPGSAPCGGTG